MYDSGSAVVGAIILVCAVLLPVVFVAVALVDLVFFRSCVVADVFLLLAGVFCIFGIQYFIKRAQSDKKENP